MKIKAIIIGLVIAFNLFSQEKKPEILFNSSSFISSGENAPFWILSNQYGRFSNYWYNITYDLGIKSEFDTSKRFDYAYAAQLMNRIDTTYTIYPHQLYVAAKLWFFDIHVGWREEVFGNAYPGLTSGNLLWSGNARSMPKISIRVPEYTPVPFTKGYLEFKGNLAHGWFEKERYVKDVWMHHKSFLVRAGGKFPINAHYGLHHFAQWGGTSPDTRLNKMPSDFEALLWVLAAKEGAPVDSLGGETINRYGNHIGSRNLGLDYKAKKWKSGIYWQTIFEDTSGKAWRNIKDGLFGIYWENKNSNPLIKAVTFEILNTTDQSGRMHDKYINDSTKVILGGSDNYLNNYIYQNGWTYNSYTQGSPFITSQELDDSKYPKLVNNKIEAFYIGLNGAIVKNQTYLLRFSYSRNYGRNNSEWDNVLRRWYFDNERPNTFESVRKSYNLLIAYNLKLEKSRSELGCKLALDWGQMYGENLGTGLSYSRRF